MTYSVRPMGKEDIAQVNEIDREAFHTQWPPPNYQRELQNQLAHYLVVCDDSKAIEKPAVVRQESRIWRLLSLGKNWLAGNHGAESGPPVVSRQFIVGFAGIWIMLDEAHLTNIAVRSDYQRRGIGELLLLSTLELATELRAGFMTLEVRVSNTVAQGLYRKFGFTEAGVRPHYYLDNREDALLMSTPTLGSEPCRKRLQQIKRDHARRWGRALST